MFYNVIFTVLGEKTCLMFYNVIFTVLGEKTCLMFYNVIFTVLGEKTCLMFYNVIFTVLGEKTCLMFYNVIKHVQLPTNPNKCLFYSLHENNIRFFIVNYKKSTDHIIWPEPCSWWTDTPV